MGTKEPPCSLGYQLHSLTAARTCAIDDQPANEMGACKVISCTTMPPIEKPNRSTCFGPSALMKVDGRSGFWFGSGDGDEGSDGDRSIEDPIGGAVGQLRMTGFPSVICSMREIDICLL